MFIFISIMYNIVLILVSVIFLVYVIYDKVFIFFFNECDDCDLSFF